MTTSKKYFLCILIALSILQPGCKHDHHNEESLGDVQINKHSHPPKKSHKMESHS